MATLTLAVVTLQYYNRLYLLSTKKSLCYVLWLYGRLVAFKCMPQSPVLVSFRASPVTPSLLDQIQLKSISLVFVCTTVMSCTIVVVTV